MTKREIAQPRERRPRIEAGVTVHLPNGILAGVVVAVAAGRCLVRDGNSEAWFQENELHPAAPKAGRLLGKG